MLLFEFYLESNLRYFLIINDELNSQKLNKKIDKFKLILKMIFLHFKGALFLTLHAV